jgi:hypothetical protein
VMVHVNRHGRWLAFAWAGAGLPITMHPCCVAVAAAAGSV